MGRGGGDMPPLNSGGQQSTSEVHLENYFFIIEISLTRDIVFVSGAKPNDSVFVYTAK